MPDGSTKHADFINADEIHKVTPLNRLISDKYKVAPL